MAATRRDTRLVLAVIDLEAMLEIAERAIGMGEVAQGRAAGGDSFLRFNLATQRAVVVEATERLKQAFADLQ